MCEGTLEYKRKVVREAMAFDFQLHSYPLYFGELSLQPLLSSKSHGSSDQREDWVDRLHRKGVLEEDLSSRSRCEVDGWRDSSVWIS